MCDFNRVAAFLIAAKAAYIFMLGFLVAAAVASGSVFAAGASIGLMAGAIASVGVAIGFYVAAAADVGSNCKGPCNASLGDVVGTLIATIALLIGVLGTLIALLAVTPVPVAGVVAITTAMVAITGSCGTVLAIESILAIRFAILFGAFNACQAAASRPSNQTLTTVFSILTGIGTVGGLGIGIIGGNLWAAGAALVTAIILFGAPDWLTITITGPDDNPDNKN